MLGEMRRRINALELDLSGLHVVTEAATGAYASTAVIAAMAGARVSARARDTRRHGRARHAFAATLALAHAAGVLDRISLFDRLDDRSLASCNILTNSGHLRPITAATIGLLPKDAVIALMFEAWEFREADFDLAACRARGIRVAAVNERHPDVAVFPFLGPLCARLLADAGLPAANRRIAVLCDNPFAEFLEAGLLEAGAKVALYPDAAAVPPGQWDALVVALDPARNAPLDIGALNRLAKASPGALLAQFWGDIDRTAARTVGFTIAPASEPGPGHMGILLNVLGHEPIIRLQAGGLRAAELLWRGSLRLRKGLSMSFEHRIRQRRFA